jgi:cytochrome c peroxidase
VGGGGGGGGHCIQSLPCHVCTEELVSSIIFVIEHLPCVSSTSLSVRTMLGSYAAAGSREATTRRIHVQIGHNLYFDPTISFAPRVRTIESSDNQGSDN